MHGVIPYETRFNVGDTVYYVRHRVDNSFEECSHCKSRHLSQKKITEMIECRVIGIVVSAAAISNLHEEKLEIKTTITLSKPATLAKLSVSDNDPGLFKDRELANQYASGDV